MLELIDEIAPRDWFVLGGESVLEARWHHRLGTEVNFFTSEERMLKLIDPFIQLTNTEKWANRGVCIEQIFGAFGVIGNTPFGEFSIYGSPNYFENSPRTDEEVEGTGVYAQSTSEIILRIMRARMIRTTFYYSQDAYDVVVAILKAPKELKFVVKNLTEVASV